MDKKLEKTMDQWLYHAFKSGNPKLGTAGNAAQPDKEKENKNTPTKGKGRRGRKQRAAAHAAGTAPKSQAMGANDEILAFLKNAGLVELVAKEWRLRNRFTGFLSAAKSGIAFVPAGKVEAIIPHNDRGAALHRDKVAITLTGFNRGRFTAKVTEIVEPFSGEYLARVLGAARGVGNAGKGENFFLAELIDLPDRPQVLLKAAKAPAKLVYLKRSVAQKQFLRDARRGEGYERSNAFVFETSPRKVTEDRKGDLERLRLRYMLPDDYAKALIPAKRDLDKLVKQELKNKERVHVKGRYIFTIDGEDAKDFDDAISVTENAEGFELDVHIADVGFFVTPETPLFEEALKRGNSYYLAGSVIPMLPEILSNEFCSLKPKTTRLAFSVRMQFDRAGRMKDYEIFKSVIYIDKRYTYKEAHENLKKKGSPLAPALRLSETLISHRDGAGRIDLNIAEQKAVYDKKGRFVGLESQARLASHRLVEECMLSANQAVAGYALRYHVPVLHRNHESMPLDKLDRLNRYLEKYVPRLKLRGVEQAEIGRVLSHQLVEPVKDVFQYLLLRSFMQANYVPEAKGHWGLAFREYSHFTSPIRRFADLVTHLQLAAHLKRERLPLNLEQLDHYGRETSRLERIAFEAERADKKLLAVRAMGGKVGQVFTAWLSGFSQERLFVSLLDFPVEGEIEAMQVDKRGEIQVLDDFSIFAGKLQKTIALGDKFKVKLVKADPLEMALKFEFGK
ncbi:MAG: VacB/RNase II family 3'-5' exoribonuclease [Spirochaetes bacterium]|nr:VacB/RNase II family 3'-5' exoribonuclease [Spirochaetota bacterium]